MGKHDSKLLPCPFCGNKVYTCSDKHGRFKAKCYRCGVEMTQDRWDKLEGIWNNRKL